jgi:hypothetical protein
LPLFFFLFLLAIIASLPYLHPAHAADIKTDLSLNTGYRVDDLSWNIAGNRGGNPSPFRLTWSDLKPSGHGQRQGLVNEWLIFEGLSGTDTFSGVTWTPIF